MSVNFLENECKQLTIGFYLWVVFALLASLNAHSGIFTEIWLSLVESVAYTGPKGRIARESTTVKRPYFGFNSIMKCVNYEFG